MKKWLTPKVKLRICGAYFGLYLILSFAYAALCPPAEFTYDLSLFRAVLIAACAAHALFVLVRKRIDARITSLVTLVLCVGLSAIDLFGLGALSDAAVVVGMPAVAIVTFLEYAGAIVVALILGFDKETYGLLDVPVNLEPAYDGGHSWDEPMSKRVRTWEFWRDLIMYFIVFSFIGHWAEILFCRLILAGVFMGGYDPTNAMLWDQWLFPFSAEGTALAAVVVFLHPIATKLQNR